MRTADISINDVGCFYEKSYRNDKMNIDGLPEQYERRFG